jgi:cytochrome c oxidase cbb3-type subunit 3
MIHIRRKRQLLQGFMMTAILTSALLSGCIQESSTTTAQAGKSQQPDVKAVGKTVPEMNLPADGAALFAKLCSSCHGTAGNGRGSRSGPSLQRPEFSYGRTPAAITQSIRDGRPGGMPAFGHVFTPRQFEALTMYILSLKK